MNTENNKLIAEFLTEQGGLVKLREDVYSTVDNFDMPDDSLILSDMPFNNSWDWLMPVVEKIESFNEGVPQQMIDLSLYSTIDEVYSGVIDFLKDVEFNK